MEKFEIYGRRWEERQSPLESDTGSSKMFGFAGDSLDECYHELLQGMALDRIVRSVPIGIRCNDEELFRDQWVGVVLLEAESVDIANSEGDFEYRIPTDFCQGYVLEDRPVVVTAMPKYMVTRASGNPIAHVRVLDYLNSEFSVKFSKAAVIRNGKETNWRRFIPEQEDDCLDPCNFLPAVKVKNYDSEVVPRSGIWVGVEPRSACVRSSNGLRHYGLEKPIVVSPEAFEGLRSVFGASILGEAVFGRDSSVGSSVVEVLSDLRKRLDLIG